MPAPLVGSTIAVAIPMPLGSRIVRLRIHSLTVAHRYSPETLIAAQAGEVENAA